MREFSCSLRKHDLYHLEMKTILPIPEKGNGRFDLNFYFFSPAQLHITKENFPRSKVLKNIQTYTRLSSPALPLAGIIERNNELSPLCRIRRLLAAAQNEITIDDDSIIHELQSLVNGYRSNIKQFVRLIEHQMYKSNEPPVSCSEPIRQTISQTESLLEQLREFYPRFLSPQISDSLRTALEWSDEAISLIAEKQAFLLRNLCKSEKTLIDEAAVITAFTEHNGAYRKAQNFTSVYTATDELKEGERIAYRESILKKWSQSALYMRVEESKVPASLNHIFAGAAAALAMTFAVLAAGYANSRFVSYSIPWAMIIIISYVFKDRIKEVMRSLFGKILPKMLADRIMLLFDPASGKRSAKTREILSYSKDKDQLEEIRTARNLTRNPFRSILPAQDVLHYNRLIILRSGMRKDHSRLESLTEVIRVRVDEWLKSMDDPEEVLYTIVDGKRKRVASNRVYHVHLIISLKETGRDREAKLFHYCLILNRRGLLRIEKRQL